MSADLQVGDDAVLPSLSTMSWLNFAPLCRSGGIGRHLGLKIQCYESGVPVRVWFAAPYTTCIN